MSPTAWRAARCAVGLLPLILAIDAGSQTCCAGEFPTNRALVEGVVVVAVVSFWLLKATHAVLLGAGLGPSSPTWGAVIPTAVLCGLFMLTAPAESVEFHAATLAVVGLLFLWLCLRGFGLGDRVPGTATRRAIRLGHAAILAACGGLVGGAVWIMHAFPEPHHMSLHAVLQVRLAATPPPTGRAQESAPPPEAVRPEVLAWAKERAARERSLRPLSLVLLGLAAGLCGFTLCRGARTTEDSRAAVA